MEATWLYALILFVLLALKFSVRGRRKLPPSPFPAIPVLGHLHLLKFPLHLTFENLSQKLGPIFSLRFGNRFVVVVSSQTLADECFTTNDVVLANRPRLIIGKYMGYNYSSIVVAPYGDHWRNLRRLAAIEVFSTSRLNAFQSIRQDEVRHLLRRLCTKHFATVELRSAIFDLTFNNIMRMVAGKRYFDVDEDDDEARRFRELKDEIVSISGVGNPADFFPFLRLIDFKGYEKKLKRITEEMDGFVQGLIDEKRGKKGGNTLIDHLLSLQEHEPDYYTDFTIKGFILVFLIGGTDTIAVTIEWAMAALLNNPDKLHKAMEDIDRLVGNDRLINESDMSGLPYLQNIISETLRLFPAAPLLVPREPSVDCKIGEYVIPRGSTVMVNVWSINRDPTVWEDPTRFMPERFEGNERNTMTFGMGRRSCPGNILAIRSTSLVIGALVQCFEWERVDGEMVDMRIGSGTSSSMSLATPLKARCKARDVLLKAI